MKIAIISDIHDNLVTLKKFLNFLKQEKIENIICCGDVTNGDTMSVLSKSGSKIYLVEGNIDFYDKKEILKNENVDFFGRLGYVELGGKKIGFCHEPFLIAKVLEKNKCDIIFYGHTHKPWESLQAGIKIINPGTLGGVFQKATFAVFDTENGNLELKVLEMM